MIPQLMARIGRWLFETSDRLRLSRAEYDTSDLSILADIAYIDDGTPEHLLDIYRPKDGADNLPMIVNIHGGGLFASYKTVNSLFNHACARMGYTVVSISYRRIPDTTLIHQIEDVMSALRFLYINRERYGLNIGRCYLTCDSAGALLGLFALSLERSEVLQQAFGIAPSGLSFRAATFISVMLETQRNDLLWFMGKVVTDSEETDAPYLPYILRPEAVIGQAQLPPISLITSAEDLIRSDTLLMDRVLTTAGVEHRLHDFPKGKQHKLVHVFSVMYPHWSESKEVLSETDAFFRQMTA